MSGIPALMLPQLIAMNLSVKVLVSLLACFLFTRSSRSFSLRSRAVRGRKPRRVGNAAFIIPFRLVDDTHRHPSSYHCFEVALASDVHLTKFPSSRTSIPRSSVSVFCQPRRELARPLHVAGIPLAPGDTRDLIQTTAGDGENRKSREEEGVDEGTAIYLQLKSVVSREIEVAGERVLMRVANHDDFLPIAGKWRTSNVLFPDYRHLSEMTSKHEYENNIPTPIQQEQYKWLATRSWRHIKISTFQFTDFLKSACFSTWAFELMETYFAADFPYWFVDPVKQQQTTTRNAGQEFPLIFSSTDLTNQRRRAFLNLTD